LFLRTTDNMVCAHEPAETSVDRCCCCRGDYFATVAPDGATRSVIVHQLSKQTSQNPFRKNRGRVTCVSFHPTKPWFLVATQNNVRVYNLAKQSLMKKLLAGGGVITSMSVHSSGDHVLLGTEDNRCLWCEPSRCMKFEASFRLKWGTR
jgi:WD40 repeat protein